MFFKGLMVGLFIGTLIGFFSAGVMAVSHKQEKKLDEQEAMMAIRSNGRNLNHEFSLYLDDDETDDDFSVWLMKREGGC